MKDKGISRDIGNRHKRAAGDAPVLGQVTRMAKTSSEQKGERRRRRVSEDGLELQHSSKHQKRAQSAMLLWTVLFGVVGLVVLGIFVFVWLKSFADRRDKMAEEQARHSKYVPLSATVIKTIGQDEAVQLVKIALKSKDDEAVEKTILLGPAALSEVTDYLKKMPAADGQILRYDWLPRLDSSRDDIEGVVVTFKKDDKQRNRIAILAKDEDGVWKMDFPAFARLSVPSWNEFLEGAAESIEARIYAAPDQYYNGAFQESDGWRCFGIASPDVPELMFGYCKEGTNQERALRDLLRDGKKMARATVQLTKVKEGGKRQFEIEHVIAQDWIAGKTAFEDEVK